MSAQELITKHLDIWTSAHKSRSTAGRGSNNKLELVGIKKLRELILELAVSGKLVPQNVNDEPVKNLVANLNSKKTAVLNQRQVSYRDISEDPDIAAMKYQIPTSWLWVRFCDAVFFQEGPGIRNWQFKSEGIKLLNVSNILFTDQLNFDNSDKFVAEDEFEQKYKHFELTDGDLLFAGSGASWGKVAWFNNPGFRVMLNTSTMRMSFFDPDFSPNYLYYFVKSPNFKKQLTSQLVGLQPNFGSTHLSRAYIALPPLAEQHRIVAKVDELMAFCDQLEQTQSDNIAAHAQLIEALLATLTNSSDHNELQNNWQRIAAHFDTLFTTEHSIDQLKQTILQLAVMGKLVHQNPSDEPASELLKKIAAEKNRLEIEERLRTTAEECIDESEHYIQLPHGWEFARLGNLAKFIDYRGKTPTKVESGIPLITAKNVRFGYIDRDPAEYITESDYEIWMTRGYPRLNDVLFTTEAPLGNVALVDIEDKFALAQRVICFQLHEPDLARFIRIAIMSAQFQNQLIENATGMTATGVKASKLKEIPIVIPPLEEQHRIVAKVDELMALCETLKINLQNAQTTQLALADALVEQALN